MQPLKSPTGEFPISQMPAFLESLRHQPAIRYGMRPARIMQVVEGRERGEKVIDFHLEIGVSDPTDFVHREYPRSTDASKVMGWLRRMRQLMQICQFDGDARSLAAIFDTPITAVIMPVGGKPSLIDYHPSQ